MTLDRTIGETIIRIAELRVGGRTLNEIAYELDKSLNVITAYEQAITGILEREYKKARVRRESIANALGIPEVALDIVLENYRPEQKSSDGAARVRKHLKQENRIQTIRKAVSNGFTDEKELADLIGVNFATVKRYIRDHNIKLPRGPSLQHLKVEKYQQLIANGERSLERIVNLLGISPLTLYNYIYKDGLRYPRDIIPMKMDQVIDQAFQKTKDPGETANMVHQDAQKIYQYLVATAQYLPHHFNFNKTRQYRPTQRGRVVHSRTRHARTRSIQDMLEGQNVSISYRNKVAVRRTVRNELLPALVNYSIYKLSTSNKPAERFAAYCLMQKKEVRVKTFPERINECAAIYTTFKTLHDADMRLSVENFENLLHTGKTPSMYSYYLRMLDAFHAQERQNDRLPKVTWSFDHEQNLTITDQKALLIHSALKNGERSIKHLSQCTDLKPVGLFQIAKRYGIEMPNDLEPYGTDPELDELINEGYSQQEIAAYRGHSRELIRQYIEYSGQYALWQKAVEKRALMERPRAQKAVKRELIATLNMLSLKKASVPGDRALNYVAKHLLKKKAQNHHNFSDKLHLLHTVASTYLNSLDEHTKITFEDLADILDIDATRLVQMVNTLGLPRGKPYAKRLRCTDYDKEIMKRGKELKLSAGDIAYFLHRNQAGMSVSMKQYFGVRDGKSLGLWNSKNIKVYCRHAHQVYEAADAGFSLDEIVELTAMPKLQVEFITQGRKYFEPKLYDMLSQLMPEKYKSMPLLSEEETNAFIQDHMHVRRRKGTKPVGAGEKQPKIHYGRKSTHLRNIAGMLDEVAVQRALNSDDQAMRHAGTLCRNIPYVKKKVSDLMHYGYLLAQDILEARATQKFISVPELVKKYELSAKKTWEYLTVMGLRPMKIRFGMRSDAYYDNLTTRGTPRIYTPRISASLDQIIGQIDAFTVQKALQSDDEAVRYAGVLCLNSKSAHKIIPFAMQYASTVARRVLDAKNQNQNLTMDDLVKETGLTKTMLGRWLHVMDLEMPRRRNTKRRTRYEQFLDTDKEAIMRGMELGMTPNDVAYLIGKSKMTVDLYMRLVNTDYFKEKHDHTFNGIRIAYSTIGKTFEALDAGFSMDETAEYANVSTNRVEFIIRNKEPLEQKMLTMLRKINPDKEITKPYIERYFVY
jgi:DNA-binding CsgD family transcriptional regulator